MTDSSHVAARDTKTIQSVLRAIGVLEAIAHSGSACSIAKIAEETGIPAPTVHRLLNTLASRGWVVKTSRREYSIGAAFFGLSSSAGSSIGFMMDEVLDRLVARTGESASVAMLDHSKAFYVAHKTSNRAMRLFTEVGNRVPLYATGVGKSLLAAMSDDDLESYLEETDLVALTEHTITNVGALREEVFRIRERGYAIDDEEQEIGVRCAASWVRGADTFALSLSGPPSRMSDEFIGQVVRPAMEQAIRDLGATLSTTSNTPRS